MSRRIRLLLTAGFAFTREKICERRRHHPMGDFFKLVGRYGSLYSKFATTASVAPGRLISVRMLYTLPLANRK